MHRFAIFITLMVLCCAVASSYSATIHVPSQQPTIQAGINAAVNGDTVLVAPGVYTGSGNYELTIANKELSLIGSGGAKSTIINGQGHFGILMYGQQTRATLIHGFTISNCQFYAGAAIRVYGGSPIIRNCLFVGNKSNWGGAAYFNGDGGIGVVSPLVVSCTFVKDTATEAASAIYFQHASMILVIERSVFWANRSVAEEPPILDGGGGATVSISCTDISGNSPENWTGILTDLAALDGNIDLDPLFCGPAVNDFRLNSSSPCAPASNSCESLIGALPQCGVPQTLRVPLDYPTIQAAIDASSNYDTVLVAPGSYTGLGNYDITTLGKQILVRAENGPTQTSIFLTHGEPYFDDRGFVINDNEDSLTVIEGFNITSPPDNWSSPWGGAVYCFNASPKFVNCIFQHQWSPGGPAAVWLVNSSPIFIGCEFSNNQAGNSAARPTSGLPKSMIGGSGGALGAENSSARFLNCTFRNNVADEGNGGAVISTNSNLVFDSCLFASNSANGNEQGADGGAVHGGGTFRDCKFIGNFAVQSGGAVYGDGTFERCLFRGNVAYRLSYRGGAIYGSGTVLNCTFVGNNGDKGSSLYSTGGLNISSSIIAYGFDRIDDEYPGPYDPPIGGTAIISCTNIYGNNTGDWIGSIAELLGTDGNLSADPRFCDSANGDFSISNSSPCAPQNNSCAQTIGAFPVSCMDNPLHVPSQFATIQAAIDAASTGDTILISAGVFSGTGNVDLNPLGKSLTLIGAGSDSTIIDCTNDGQNHRGLWIRNGEVDFRLQSLSIRNGAPPSLPAGLGGGALLIESDTKLTIDNCVLHSKSGGTISFPNYGSLECQNTLVDGGNGTGLLAWIRSINLSNVRFVNSSTGFDAAADTITAVGCQFVGNNLGVSITGSAPVFVECRFDSNTTIGLHAQNSEFSIQDCSFAYNGDQGLVANECGRNMHIVNSWFIANSESGIAFWASSALMAATIKSSTFIQNTSTRGGAINCDYDYINVTVDSCTIVGNHSADGAAVYSEALEAFQVSNTVIAYNTGSNPIVLHPSVELFTTSCTNIFGNSGGDWVGDIADQFGVNGNISANPLFCDTANGDFHIAAESPCAPVNNSCNQQIGAFGVACSVKPGVIAVGMENEALANVLSPTPTIQWAVSQPVPSPQDSFLIAVGTDNDWQFAEKWNPAPFASSDTFVTYDGSALLDGQTYYLRLRVHNTLAWSDWYQTSFRMNSVPSAPLLRAPTNLTVVGSTPILWLTNGTDAQNDPLTYEFAGFHDTDCVSGPDISLTGVTQTADSTGGQIVDPLAENCRYFWRARAFDGFEYSAWTDLAQFLVNGTPEAPTAPSLDYPPLPDNKPIFTLLPTLTWQPSYDPDPSDTVRYKLELSDRANFSFALVRDSLLATDLPLVDSLVFGTHYYWRVTSRDKTGLGAVSSVKEFWTWKLGDMNHSHSTDLSDLSLLIAYLVQTPRPDISPKMLADLTGDCKIDLSDLSLMISFMTTSGIQLQVGCE